MSNSTEMQAILDFVSGTTPPEEFAKLLAENSSFEKLLDDAKELPNPSYITKEGCANTYQYILKLNSTILKKYRLSYALNVQGALEQFLHRRGIAFTSTDKYRTLHSILLDTQPSWVDVDMDYFQTHIFVQVSDNLKSAAFKKALREKFKELFKFASKPPRWIQGPAWPILNGRPLVFLGQLEIKNYFHDTAAAYVFHDKESGECKTVIQTF